MSIRLNQIGNKAGKISATVLNGESSAAIPVGTPVILKVSTTVDAANDGLSVVLPATAGNPLSYAARYGVITSTVAAGGYGESVLFGCVSARVTLTTRAASTDSWSATASSASGIALGIDTINNNFTMGASVGGSIATNHIDALLLDSVSNVVASASATTDTRTANTGTYRVFVRML